MSTLRYRLTPALRALGERHGGHFRLGTSLHRLFAEVGLAPADVGANFPFALRGETKRLIALSFQEFAPELVTLGACSGGEGGLLERLRARDELYEQAIEVIVREGRGSTSLLQRALGIGYGRAARLVDFMAEDGIVGDYNGSQAREVLYTPEQWEQMKTGAAYFLATPVASLDPSP